MCGLWTAGREYWLSSWPRMKRRLLGGGVVALWVASVVVLGCGGEIVARGRPAAAPQGRRRHGRAPGPSTGGHAGAPRREARAVGHHAPPVSCRSSIASSATRARQRRASSRSPRRRMPTGPSRRSTTSATRTEARTCSANPSVQSMPGSTARRLWPSRSSRTAPHAPAATSQSRDRREREGVRGAA